MAAEWKVGDTVIISGRECIVTAVDDSKPGVVDYTVQPTDATDALGLVAMLKSPLPFVQP